MPATLAKVGRITYTRGPWIDRWGHRHPAVKVTRKVRSGKSKRRKRKKRTRGRNYLGSVVTRGGPSPQGPGRLKSLPAPGGVLLLEGGT